MTRHYVTACRDYQLPVLLASMRRHCGDFKLHVLAWDYHPFRVVNDGAVSFTTRNAFLGRHPNYAPDRLPGPPRPTISILDTVRWRWFADLLEDVGELTCIDGDQFFFGSPEPLFAEIPPSAALAVSPHRIPPRAAGLPGACYETHFQYGEFNTGFSFWRSPAALAEMCERTYAWSYPEVRQHPIDGRPDFGDAGSLERVARRHGAHVIQHIGVNVAPWNANLYKFVERSGLLLVDAWPVVDCRELVTYHFSSLALNPDGTVARLAYPQYEVERAPGAVDLIYAPYLAALAAARAVESETP